MEQCKLCLQSVAPLRDSHFLSAGIYRILRDDNEKNPNPWVLSGKGAVQISRQMKAHLLCADCEQRFSKFGERWVLKHCFTKGWHFPAEVYPLSENTRHIVPTESDKDLLRFRNS